MCQIVLSIPDEVLYDTKMNQEQANQFARSCHPADFKWTVELVMQVACFYDSNEENNYFINWYLQEFTVDEIKFICQGKA